jgi:hypothetical protein
MTSQTPRGRPHSGPIVQQPAEPTNQPPSAPLPAEPDPSSPGMLDLSPPAPTDGPGVRQDLKGTHLDDGWRATIWDERRQRDGDY